MIARRLVYICVFCAAFAFYVDTASYFSWALLVLVVAFLPLELLLSLPARKNAGVQLALATTEVPVDKALVLRLHVVSGVPACFKATLLCENLLTGRRRKIRLRLPAHTDIHYDYDICFAECGVVRFSLLRPRVLDVAGLFALPFPKPAACEALVRPVWPALLDGVPEDVALRMQQDAAPPATPGPAAGGASAVVDIRAYRPGDALRDIHWKLTAKHDELMVRERLDDSHAAAIPRLGFNFWGGEPLLRQSLAQLETLSASLADMGVVHDICWRPSGQLLKAHRMETRADFDALLWQALGSRLPQTGTPLQQEPLLAAEPLWLVQGQSFTLHTNDDASEVW